MILSNRLCRTVDCASCCWITVVMVIPALDYLRFSIQRPKTMIVRLLCEAKAKDYSFKAIAKAKDTITWPRG